MSHPLFYSAVCQRSQNPPPQQYNTKQADSKHALARGKDHVLLLLHEHKRREANVMLGIYKRLLRFRTLVLQTPRGMLGLKSTPAARRAVYAVEHDIADTVPPFLPIKLH